MDCLKDRLLKAKEAGHWVMLISMDQDEIDRMLELIDREKEPVEKQDFEIGYKAGYEYGYQRAVVDVVKKVKGMKWYGGNGQKHADQVPGDHKGRTEDMQ